MSEFKPGDVVVLVIDGEYVCRHLCRHRGCDLPPFNKPLRVVAVEQLILDGGLGAGQPCGCAFLSFADGRTGITDRFRHLPKADPAFTEAMRALRPEKEGVA